MVDRERDKPLHTSPFATEGIRKKMKVKNIKIEKDEGSSLSIKKEPLSPKICANKNPTISNRNPSTSINVQSIKVEKDESGSQETHSKSYDPRLQNPSPPPSYFIENQRQYAWVENIKMEWDDEFISGPAEESGAQETQSKNYDPEFQNPSPPPSYFIENQRQYTRVENIKLEWDAGCSHDVKKDESCIKPHEKWPSGSSVHSFYCEVCNLRYLLEEHYLGHVKSDSHRKKQEEVRFVSQNSNRPILTGVNVHNIGNDSIYRLQVFSRLVENCRPFIQSEIDEYSSSAVVGLNFVSEIRMLREEQDPVYYCYLCAAKCQVPTILNHIVSSQHKMAYMRLLHLETYKNVKFILEQKQYGDGNPIEGWSAHLEALDGRGQMMVEMQIDPDEEDLESIIESKMTHLPVASYRKLWNELDNIDENQHTDLIKHLIEANSSKETVEAEFYAKFESMLILFEKSVHEKICANLMDDPEKKKILSELAKAQNYHGIMEFLLKRGCGSTMGANAKPVVLSLLQKPGIVRPIKRKV